MASVPNTNTTAELTKRVYGENLEKLPFELTIGAEAFKFRAADKLGDVFRFPVTLTMEHGATYNGTSGGKVTLNDAISATIKQAEVPAYEMLLRSQVTYRLMKDAAAQGPAAFEAATRVILENLQESAEFRREHSIWYGHHGLGVVQTVTNNTTSMDLLITEASWSAATWEALEGAVVEAFATTAASATQHDGDLTITAVNLDTRTITIDATADAFTNVANGDIIYFKGAKTTTSWNEMMGVAKLMTTTSGTVHGINPATYSRWKPNVLSSMGTPTFAQYLSGVSKLTARRIRRTKTNVWFPPKAYEKIASDLMSYRRFDGSYSKSKTDMGTESLAFFGQTGMTDMIPNAIIRDGDSFAATDNNGFRVGSTDLTFDLGPSGQKSDMWFHLPDTNVMEVRCIVIQQPFFFRPSHTLGYSGLTYS